MLRETYDRIARRWQALSPRARNKRLLELARGGTIPLAGLVHISAATQAEPAEDPTTPAAAKGRGKRPRYLPGDLRPSAVTARSDPKYQQDLDAGLTSQDAFKRHKSRFRALLHAMKSGKDIPTTPARQGRTTGELPPLQSRGRRHKEEMLWRLEQLRRRGIVPTREENNQAVNLDSLLDYLEPNFPPGHERERNGRPDQWGEPPSRYDTADDLPEEGRPKSKARSSLQSQAQSSAPTEADSSRPAPPQNSAGPWDVYNRTPDPGHAASSSTTGAPPETSPGAPMEVEEEGAPEEEICFTGDYSDMAPDYDE